MADDAQNRKDRYAGLRRILVRVPYEAGLFLDGVVRNTDEMYKNEMWTAIWAAGFRAVTGQDMTEVAKLTFPPYPKTVEVHDRTNIHTVAREVLKSGVERTEQAS